MKIQRSAVAKTCCVSLAMMLIIASFSAHAQNVFDYIPEGVPKAVREELEKIPKLKADRVTQPGDADLAKEAIETLADTVRGIESIRFVTVKRLRKDEFRGMLSGEKYRVEEWSGRIEDTRRIYAFDGERGWFLDLKSAQMNVQGGELPIARKLLENLNYSPLCIFDFMCTEGSCSFFAQKDAPTFWNGLVRRSSYQGERQIAGADCTVVRIRKGYDPHLEREVTYDVYLAKKRGMWPVAWEAFDEDGIQVHKVVAEESVEPDASRPSDEPSFPLPTRISLWRSLSKGQFKVEDIPVKYMPQETEIIFSEVSVNNVRDADLTIDPSLAKTIWDLETDTWIQTPR